MKIGDFSRLSNTSVRMLRHYDEIELLKPNSIDQESGYRYYKAEQLDIINKISKLKELGFSLAVIKSILENENDREFVKKYLLTQQAQLLEESEKIKMQIALLEDANKIFEQGKVDNMYSVVYKKIAKRKVAGYRDVISGYDQEGVLWGKLYETLGKMGVKFSDNPMTSAIFHDKEYKEVDVDVEVQVGVDGDYQDSDGVKFYETDEMEVASVTFRGSYDQMSDVSEEAAKWIENSGYEMNGSMFNIYHVSPAQDQNPENWVTESCFTIKKK